MRQGRQLAVAPKRLRSRSPTAARIAQEQTGGGRFSFPVTELAEVFLTEPAELSGGGDMGSIYGEILRTVSIEENLTIIRREFVQLY